MSEQHGLAYRELGIDTSHEYVVFVRADCDFVRQEGITSHGRVEVKLRDKSIIATVNIVESALLACAEVGLSKSASRALGAKENDPIQIRLAAAPGSLRLLRSKIYGNRLDRNNFKDILEDIIGGRYSSTQVAALLTVLASQEPDIREAADFTAAMVDVGQQLSWDAELVADKHCVGGLPGNRTTPIVVAIAAECGLTMPKTSSRAITSPAGTADVMEVVTNVTLSAAQIRNVVNEQGGCMAWGGSFSLSPADDVLINVARPLELDSDVQLVASVLSKKIAAGATHVIIDMPVGPTAKIRSATHAQKLSRLLTEVAHGNNLNIRIVQTDGSQPVGQGIGPALEARDVLRVLRCDPLAPRDLRERALTLVGELLEFCGVVPKGQGLKHATHVLESGNAYQRFIDICIAQGEFKEPATACFQHTVYAQQDGAVAEIHNRHLTRLTYLLGAPGVKTAGVDLHCRLNDQVQVNQPLMTLHTETQAELMEGLEYLKTHAVYTIDG